MKKLISVILLVSMALLAMGGALAEADAQDPSAAFVGEWVSDRARLTIEQADDTFHCLIQWGNSAFDATEWEYDCMYDEVAGGLTSLETGVKRIVTYDAAGEATDVEVVFEDGAANFALNDDDTLTWTDFKETPGENEVVFERAQPAEE